MKQTSTNYTFLHIIFTFTITRLHCYTTNFLLCKGTDNLTILQRLHDRKRLDASLPPLGSRVRVSVTPCRFRAGLKGVWVGFLGFLPFFPAINFILPFLYTHLIHFVSFTFISSFDGASGVVGRSFLITDLKYRSFVATSHSDINSDHVQLISEVDIRLKRIRGRQVKKKFDIGKLKK